MVKVKYKERVDIVGFPPNFPYNISCFLHGIGQSVTHIFEKQCDNCMEFIVKGGGRDGSCTFFKNNCLCRKYLSNHIG